MRPGGRNSAGLDLRKEAARQPLGRAERGLDRGKRAHEAYADGLGAQPLQLFHHAAIASVGTAGGECAFKMDQADRLAFRRYPPGHGHRLTARIKDAGGIRSQFHHVIDIVPTILEATGIPAPVMVDGVAQKPIEGVSMAYTFDKANADAPSTRTTQYFEMLGNRAMYHDGWIAITTPPQPPWLLGLAKMPNVVNGYKWSSTTSRRISRRTTT